MTENAAPSPTLPAAQGIVRLGADVTHAVGLIGGKGAGLERMMVAGLNVPPTFCVTTPVFDRAITRILRDVPGYDDLVATLREHAFPRQLRDAIAACLESIDAEQWAVRSSATDEDSVQLSFAGQQISRLHVEGVDAVCAAIREVWASLFSEDALMYRANNDDEELIPSSIAVLLQPMLAPVSAGVLFTHDPTGNPRDCVVSATEGLGTSVVEGRGGTTYYIERSSGYLRRTEGDQNPLSPPQIKRLSQLADTLDKVFERPLDLEWAIVPDDEDAQGLSLALLQLRPAQTGAQQHTSKGGDTTVWTNANVGEALPGVGTPMTWSIIRSFARRGFERAFGTLGLSVPEEYALVDSFQGRVYLNLGQFMSIASGFPLMKPETLFSLAGGGGVEMVKGVYTEKSPREFIVNLPLTIPRIIASQLALPVVAKRWEERFEAFCADFFRRDLTRLTQTEMSALFADIDARFESTGLVMLTGASNFLMSYVVLREFLRLFGDDEAVAKQQMLVGGIEVKSSEPGLALLQLGRIARRSRVVRNVITQHPPAEVHRRLVAERGREDVDRFLRKVAEFRDTYGHRAPREAELATPRWREETSFIYEVVRGFVRAPRIPSEREVERETAAQRTAIEEFTRETFSPAVRPVFRTLLAWTRTNARRREALRARVVDSLDVYRRFFLECGRRLERSGVLGAAEDVFYLRSDEVRRWLDDPEVAASFRLRAILRRRVSEMWNASPDPPGTFMVKQGRIISEEEALPSPKGTRALAGSEDRRIIQGLPGCAGRVTGRARVLIDPHADGGLRHGDVLVVPYADVGWTPLFLTASAVVMTLGGPLSHACIVAREYGIPTVVNAKNAAQIISDGDLITVDGDRGEVVIEEYASGAAEEA